MSVLTKEHLHYLRTVLGVRTFLQPLATPALPVAEALIPEATPILSDARLLALFPLAAEDFPLRGELAELVSKMIKAMKLDTNQVLIAEWVAPEMPEGVQAELQQAALAQRPVVVFGYAPGFLDATVPQGTWWEESGAQLIGTHSARDLVGSPAKKKEAWAHLQMVMRHLGV